MISSDIGFATVHSTSHRGFTPEEVAERCVDKIISVSDTASPEAQAQARAFRENIKHVVVFYLKEAVRSDRTTIYNCLLDAGRKDLAELIVKL